MGSFFAGYPYFSGGLLGLLIFSAIVFFFRSQRRMILLSGLLAMPQALFALFLVPQYWNRRSIAVAWGNKFIVQIDPKNNTYRIASTGSDGRFSGFNQKGEYSDLAGKDIIFADGIPVFVPKLGL
jgi:hypothetical protein